MTAMNSSLGSRCNNLKYASKIHLDISSSSPELSARGQYHRMERISHSQIWYKTILLDDIEDGLNRGLIYYLYCIMLALNISHISPNKEPI